MPSNFLLYGANGYTGKLIARLSKERGLRPILAGRDQKAIEQLAAEHGLEQRVFALDDSAALDAALREVSVVLHCAGPFSRTSQPMVDACMRTKTHYLDITGEATVIETLAARDREAQSAEIMLLPSWASMSCLRIAGRASQKAAAYGDASDPRHSGHGTRVARNCDDDGGEYQSRWTRPSRWQVDRSSCRVEDS